MIKITPTLLALAIACSGPAQAQSIKSAPVPALPQATESAIVFSGPAGETTEAFEGTFTVPENRADPASRTLTLHYVRFPATTAQPGSPIVYLAGGPGGSGIGTASQQRFPLFMAMREFGDVIALDQRGTGASNDLPYCVSSQSDDHDVPTPDATEDTLYVAALRDCLTFWKDKGIDVHGYTTRENAADLDALRRHLGAEKISLWGISYGSHLALAAIKQMPDHLDRIVIASGEGLDQTIKLPARTDAYFARLQQAIDSQPDARAMFPDVAGLIRRVHARLETDPVLIQIPQSDGSTRPYLWQRRDMQTLTAALISDPPNSALALQIYAGLDRGDTGLLLALAPRFTGPTSAVGLSPMSTLTDIASGTGTDRRALIAAQARTALLGTALNQSVLLEDVDPTLVMDDSFRQAPFSDIHVLLLSGTLDGRTYPESQAEAVAGLSNRQIVTVRNAGHNLFMTSPDVTATILSFMRGETVDGREIIVDLPDLSGADKSFGT